MCNKQRLLSADELTSQHLHWRCESNKSTQRREHTVTPQRGEPFKHLLMAACVVDRCTVVQFYYYLFFLQNTSPIISENICCELASCHGFFGSQTYARLGKMFGTTHGISQACLGVSLGWGGLLPVYEYEKYYNSGKGLCGWWRIHFF